jgi:hypothetical protein
MIMHSGCETPSVAGIKVGQGGWVSSPLTSSIHEGQQVPPLESCPLKVARAREDERA